MRLQPTCWLAAVAACAVSAGCQKDNALTASLDKSYKDDIQQVVEAKIAERSEPRTGPQRWDTYKQDEYQGAGAAEQDPRRRSLELQRRRKAEELLAAGPLSLTDCLACSLEFNDPIQASRAVVRATGGEKLIARSRFLPRLAYDLTAASASENLGRNVAMGLTAIQTLLEFGKDNPIDAALRELQRQALFGYEQAVAEVLSEVRLRFYTILLKSQQLAQRQELRKEFAARLEQMRSLEQARRVLELDVLTAQLNVLEESLRINALEKEIVRQKMDLLKAIGFPVGMTDFSLRGQVEDFGVPMDESVEIAFRRSTRIAQARATVFEQDRVVRQLIWDYMPAVAAHGGYRGRFAAAGTALQTDDGVYGLMPFAEQRINRVNGNTLLTDPTFLGNGQTGWYWDLTLELPLFTGLERTGHFQREGAMLDQTRHLLCDTIAATELDVRKAHQTVLERRREVDILRERVNISKARLRVQERLKELGKITDDQLDRFREQFFADQDGYFERQIRLIEAQELLRRAMRYFEPAAAKGTSDGS